MRSIIYLCCGLMTLLSGWATPVYAVDPTKENFFQLGTLAARDGEYEHAVDFFRKAIELDPKFVPAYNSLGVLYETSRLENLNEAVRYFKLATDIDPSLVESWNNLGRAYYSRAEFAKSEQALLRSLALKPDQPDVEISLGWVNLLGQSRGADAIRHFEKGGAQRDRNPMVSYGMGLAYLIEGDRFKILDSITELRKHKREDLAIKLESMLKSKVRLTSRPGTPLITGVGDEHAVLNNELKALGKTEGSTDGIQVRLRGPIRD